MDGREKASCRDADPDLFFLVGDSGPTLLQIDEAKAVCRLLRGRPCGARRVGTTLCSSAPVQKAPSCATPVALFVSGAPEECDAVTRGARTA